MEQEALQRAFFNVMHHWGTAKKPALFVGLTHGEFFTLEQLAQHRKAQPDAKGMYVSQLVISSHVSGPAVSRTLRLLDEKGYIERYVDKADRRNTYITLTEAGGDAWERAVERLGLFVSRVIDRMGHREMAELISLWNRLIDAINEVGAD